MTEKRFLYDWKTGKFKDICFNHKKKIKKLIEENEQLKNFAKRQQKSNEECSKYIEEVAKENKELKRQVKKIIFDINALIDVSAPNTEKISVLLDLKEKIIETFEEWVIIND